MKTKIIIKKNGIIQDQPYLFDDQVTLDNFLEMIKINETFGKPEHQEMLTPTINNEDGTVTAATYQTIPSEYTIEQSEYIAPIASISPRQIRLALLALGITETMVDAAIATMPSPQKEEATIAWKYSTSFEREVPAVALIGTMLGYDSIGLDQLWIAAVAL
jgi:hypothetical protein